MEIGAGTGANFPCYSGDVHVLALEPDPSMARRARAKIEAASVQIELRIADDRLLDTLPPNSVDAVVFTLVLCTVTDPLATLGRARRVLKANGMLVLLEHVRSGGTVGRFQDCIAPLWRCVAGGCHLNRDTSAAIAAAGFDVGAIRSKTLTRLSPIQELIYGTAQPMPAG